MKENWRPMKKLLLLTLLGLAIFISTNGSSLQAAKPADTDSLPPAKKFSYLCEDGKRFTLEIDSKEDCVLLTLDGRPIKLPRVRAASGARYSNGKTTVWLKGNEAFIEMDGKIIIKNCRAQD
jgi:membrane-bound inhibitor of C-type lysozyme